MGLWIPGIAGSSGSVDASEAVDKLLGEGFAGHQLNFVANIVCCSMELGSRSDLSGFEGL